MTPLIKLLKSKEKREERGQWEEGERGHIQGCLK